MAIGKLECVDILMMLGISVACFVAFLTLIPDVKPARSTVRAMQSYHDVCELVESYEAAQPVIKPAAEGTISTAELSEADPWGTPYRLVKDGDGQVRVFSAGPNMAFASDGIDKDDIYSDMPVSPFEAFSAHTNRQWLVALASPIVLWRSEEHTSELRYTDISRMPSSA